MLPNTDRYPPDDSQRNSLCSAPSTRLPKHQSAPHTIPQRSQAEDESSLVRQCTRPESSTHTPTATTGALESFIDNLVDAKPHMQANPSTGSRHHADVMITASPDSRFADLITVKCVAPQVQGHGDLGAPLSEDAPERPGRVRFRSRVRITSGLNRHRHKSSYSEHQESPHVSFSRSSSLSGSPSSSISAPLRNQAEDEVGKPGWGTLGQRVSILTQGNSHRRKQREQREQAQAQALLAKSVQLGISLPSGRHQYGADERTPLITSSSPYLYVRHNGEVTSSEESAEEAERFARDVDIVFGPWPARLWNHHWWWWHMEPILCCRCLTELDDEG
ncbi:hypothetical protein BDN70DRAFT_888283 [Pholiota conissans]|uniref:Uncharacterized protein n=1 Tax=Pholiota conissans TaxID=109636 RepID=A0A9P5YL56_9AGAR|nr:hypothetical protein BDN70DRAFT_888283 [Pholiota conissans]